MTENNTSLAVRENSNAGAISPFSSKSAFADAQEMLAPLMDSTMVPECYRAYTLDKNKQWTENPAALGNCLMAMEIATRTRKPLALVMQHMVPIKGRAGWDAAYIAGEIASCGRFSTVRYDEADLGPIDIGGTKIEHNLACTAWVVEKATNERINGVTITMEMAVREGWYATNPKYRSMPQNMLRKRALTFLGRDIVSDLLCGMACKEELEESIDIETVSVPTPTQVSAASLASTIAAAPKAEPVTVAEPAEEAPKAERKRSAPKQAKREPEPVIDVAPEPEAEPRDVQTFDDDDAF